MKEQETQAVSQVPTIGTTQVQELSRVLVGYKAAKARLDSRVVSSERWWMLRNSEEEDVAAKTRRTGYKSKSGWLHNVIVSKHADAMDAYPAPSILPREQGDREQARMLTAIVPCVLEQNHFEDTYSAVTWAKLKSGTGIYKVVWDKSKLGGLGDIGIERVSVLNLFWEPGITDIQRSRYVFHTELWDKELLVQRYPELEGKALAQTLQAQQFDSEDSARNGDKVTVVDCYYRKGGRLQYVKYVCDYVLYATENDPEQARRGLYDHGLYPYVPDVLFPLEGSLAGYGFVDLCKTAQTEIDLIKTSVVNNTMQGATPRYFARGDGSINETEFLDLSKPIVHVQGNLGEDSIRPIETVPLSDAYLSYLASTVQELRETSGNTETATGSTSSGVTAASAIAALQEASGKGSKDATRTSYRAYSKVVELCIELIRQFYDAPRKFRILGERGGEQFVTFNNTGLQPQYQGNDFGQDMGYRLPVFDIKVSAQKQSVYTTLSNNELALQLFQLGFFNPQLTDQALMCLDMMEFQGKDALMQQVSSAGTTQQKLLQYQQLALMLAQQYRPDMVAGLALSIAGNNGLAMPSGEASASIAKGDHLHGGEGDEIAQVRNARERSQQASQPDEGRVIAERKK